MDIRLYNIKSLPYHFVLFYNVPTNQMIMQKMALNGRADDNAVLTYCYLDGMCGLSYKAICCARISDNGRIQYTVPDRPNAGMTLREGAINSDAIIFDEEPEMAQFQKEADFIKECYGYDKESVAINDDIPFDKFRHPSYPMDIFTNLYTPDQKVEKIWLREVSRTEDGVITARFIDEPFNPLVGLHDGDTVKIIPYDKGDGEIEPTAVLPWMRDM